VEQTTAGFEGSEPWSAGEKILWKKTTSHKLVTARVSVDNADAFIDLSAVSDLLWGARGQYGGNEID
jgi:hypothetical protein